MAGGPDELDVLSDDAVLQAATLVFEQLSERQAWQGMAPGWADVQIWNDLLREEAAAQGAGGVEQVLDGTDRASQALLAREVLRALAQDPQLGPVVHDATVRAREQHLAPPALLVGAAVFLLKAVIASVDVDYRRAPPAGERHLTLAFDPEKLQDYLKTAVASWLPH